MDYHQDYSRVSASMLKVLMRSPQEYYQRFITAEIQQAETDAMRFGSMFHCSVLEPDLFASQYVVMPDFHLEAGNVTGKGERSESKATSYYKAKSAEWIEANKGRTFCTNDEILLVSKMAKACYEHDSLAKLLTAPGEIELPIYWRDRINKKCKPDKVLHDYRVILDLKTCDEANPGAFASKCAKLGYFLQAHWYREALWTTRNDDYRFVFAAVSKKPPYEVGLYELTTDDMEWAEQKCESLVSELIEREENNNWSASWQSGINQIALPRWARNEWYEMESV